MAFHVRDPKTDRLVRELARRRGVGLTEAIRAAVERDLQREEAKPSLWERTADIRARLRENADADFVPDKAFYDELWGEEER